MKQLIEKKGLSGRLALLFLADIIMIQISSISALWIRYDMSFLNMDRAFLSRIIGYAPIHTAIAVSVFFAFGMYNSLWTYASVNELLKVCVACICVTITDYIGLYLMNYSMPRSYLPMALVIHIGLIAAVRFSYRIGRVFKLQYQNNIPNKASQNVMVIGAGAAGAMIIKELQNSDRCKNDIICVIDDDKEKQGKTLHGCPIVGGREEIFAYALKQHVDKIIVALPSVPKREIRNILHICKETGCELQILPGLYQMINGEVMVSKLREVQLEDLLGRDQIQVDLQSISGYVQEKVVLVTGGGGSIGSELCRQIAKYNPKQLIIFDIYENNAYDIQQELVKSYPQLDLKVLIGSVRNENRINKVFATYRPQIVYHAAAHKHVPLMEESPNEAIKNNVFGTYKTAMAADKYGCERFVLISTDKAVNPTNIMGASKRLCEMIVQTVNKNSKTDYVAVRFGNVLGSNGSVIPLFKKQIAQGGPVTVTHPDIIRYFMTIPEAVSLVLQAGSYAKGGEIFVLEMGEPVRIVDMAKNLIKFSGYMVGEDIAIEYTGLRPGEKLYEEKLMEEEGLTKTENELIHIGKPIDMDTDAFYKQLAILKVAAEKEEVNIKKIVAKMVPTYVLAGEETSDQSKKYIYFQDINGGKQRQQGEEEKTQSKPKLVNG